MTAFEVLISARGSLGDAERLELAGFAEFQDGSLAVLHGAVGDEAALMGLLERLRRAGLRIRDVERLLRSEHAPTRANAGILARLEIRGLVADLLQMTLADAGRVEECATTTVEVTLPDDDALFSVLAELENLALDIHALHVRPAAPTRPRPAP